MVSGEKSHSPFATHHSYMQNLSILLFDNFETLDVFGPVEIFGRLTDIYAVEFYSLRGDVVKNAHGVKILTQPLAAVINGTDIFLIPGGFGTRVEVNNLELVAKIKSISEKSAYVLTVCTGSALLAKTGLLDGKNATSNKRAFNWVMSQGEKVNWNKQARWEVDGKYYTSAGVSAGMDMSLGFIADKHGIDFARRVAFQIEYNWQEDKERDNFSEQ